MSGRRMTQNVVAFTTRESRFVPKGMVVLMADLDAKLKPGEMDTAADLFRLTMLPTTTPPASSEER